MDPAEVPWKSILPPTPKEISPPLSSRKGLRFGSRMLYLSVQWLPEPHHTRVRFHGKEAGGLLPRYTKHQRVIVHVSGEQLGHRRTWRTGEEKKTEGVTLISSILLKQESILQGTATSQTSRSSRGQRSPPNFISITGLPLGSLLLAWTTC